MSIVTGIKIEGLEELEKKLDPKPLLSGSVKDLLGKAALVVEGIAKQKASGRPGPRVQTGRLRSSITHTLDASPVPLFAKVGSNVEYAKYLELGTERMPGGYPFLEPARKDATGKIEGLLSKAKRVIEDAWKK